MTIEEICRRAKAEGLTYGQYVSKHRAELAGIRPTRKVRAGYIRCPSCGRDFIRSSPKQKFCSPRCYQNTWNKVHRPRKKGK